MRFWKKVLLVYGGGSVIDCSKGVSAVAVIESGNVWDLVSNRVWVTKALPVVAILTNAVTASEIDAWAVTANIETNEKIGFGGSSLGVAFENPELSFSLPPYQTA